MTAKGILRPDDWQDLGSTAPSRRTARENRMNPRAAEILANPVPLPARKRCLEAGGADTEARRPADRWDSCRSLGRRRHQGSAAMILPSRSMLPRASRCSRPGHCMRNRMWSVLAISA
jgi:hypothetical protein